MDAKDLNIGDILLLKDNNFNYTRHAAIVSHVDPVNNIFKILHLTPYGDLTGFIEISLPGIEILEKKNRQFECFRMADQEKVEQAMKILTEWLSWAVPYDKKRFKDYEAYFNEVFSTSFDSEKELYSKMDPGFFSQQLEKHQPEMEKLFAKHYMDIVKFASRRETSPVRPTNPEEKATGFHCLPAIILAFQIAHVLDFVKPVSDKWLSNKYAHSDTTLDSKHPTFESVKSALKEDFDKEKFLAAIPPALRVHAKLCSLDAFKHALLADKKTFINLGVLNLLKTEDIKPNAETMKNIGLFAKSKGTLKRENLRHKITAGMK